MKSFWNGLTFHVFLSENHGRPKPSKTHSIKPSRLSFRIRLGDSTVEYNEEFRLFITTKLPNPHYSPEICVQARCWKYMKYETDLQLMILSFCGILLHFAKWCWNMPDGFSKCRSRCWISWSLLTACKIRCWAFLLPRTGQLKCETVQQQSGPETRTSPTFERKHIDGNRQESSWTFQLDISI